MLSKVDTEKGQNILTIHVFDEGRQTTKDFYCERDLLLANMKYFEQYLNENEKPEEIDI